MAGFNTKPCDGEATKSCTECGMGYSKGGQAIAAFLSSKFCSKACYLKLNWTGEKNPRYKPRPLIYCRGCGKSITPRTRATNRIDRLEGRKFCNNSCRLGPLNTNWQGGRYKVQKGYIRVAVGDGTSQYEHIVIAERALGRKLKRGEVVHHIDGVKDNNANSNLFICTNEYHRWLHEEMSRLYALEKFGPKPSLLAQSDS